MATSVPVPPDIVEKTRLYLVEKEAKKKEKLDKEQKKAQKKYEEEQKTDEQKETENIEKLAIRREKNAAIKRKKYVETENDVRKEKNSQNNPKRKKEQTW